MSSNVPCQLLWLTPHAACSTPQLQAHALFSPEQHISTLGPDASGKLWAVLHNQGAPSSDIVQVGSRAGVPDGTWRPKLAGAFNSVPCRTVAQCKLPATAHTPLAPALPCAPQVDLGEAKELARISGVGDRAQGLVFWDRYILTLDSGGGALVRADPVSGDTAKLWQVGSGFGCVWMRSRPTAVANMCNKFAQSELLFGAGLAVWGACCDFNMNCYPFMPQAGDSAVLLRGLCVVDDIAFFGICPQVPNAAGWLLAVAVCSLPDVLLRVWYESRPHHRCACCTPRPQVSPQQRSDPSVSCELAAFDLKSSLLLWRRRLDTKGLLNIGGLGAAAGLNLACAVAASRHACLDAQPTSSRVPKLNLPLCPCPTCTPLQWRLRTCRLRAPPTLPTRGRWSATETSPPTWLPLRRRSSGPRSRRGRRRARSSSWWHSSRRSRRRRPGARLQAARARHGSSSKKGRRRRPMRRRSRLPTSSSSSNSSRAQHKLSSDDHKSS